MRFLAYQTQARRHTLWLYTLYIVLVALVSLALAGVFYLSFMAVTWRTFLIGYEGWRGFAASLPYTAGVPCAVILCLSAWQIVSLRSQGPARLMDAMNARMISASRAETPAERQLLNVVAEVALAAQHRAPIVFVMDHEPSINAFAAGTLNTHFVVGISAGALRLLNRDELQAMVGHEMSHIIEGDAAVNMTLSGLSYGLNSVYALGEHLCDNESKSWGTSMAGLVLLFIGYLGVLAAELLQASVSQQREFLADAGSVRLTRNPSAMVAALSKIQTHTRLDLNQSALHNASAKGHAYAFFNAQRLSHTRLESDAQAAQGSDWLATHPPLRERIRRVLQM